jgi:hypothetical protein
MGQGPKLGILLECILQSMMQRLSDGQLQDVSTITRAPADRKHRHRHGYQHENMYQAQGYY